MHNHVLGPGAVDWLGSQYRTILKTDQTGGAMAIVDSVSAVGSGPPRHVHHDADETFVLLTGECRFWLEGETMLRGPGETVFVPRGKEHSFVVIGDLPCRHLIILTPGGFEGFFYEMAERGCRIPQDMAQIARIGAAYELEFTGPPMDPE